MKKIISLFFCTFILLNISMACEIEIEIDAASKKEVYKPNDEVVVMVTITHDHRKCELKNSDTDYSTEGVKILSATDWKELSDGSFQRKMKLQILGSKNGKSVFKVIRNCTKNDNVGIIRFTTTPQ